MSFKDAFKKAIANADTEALLELKGKNRMIDEELQNRPQQPPNVVEDESVANHDETTEKQPQQPQREEPKKMTEAGLQPTQYNRTSWDSHEDRVLAESILQSLRDGLSIEDGAEVASNLLPKRTKGACSVRWRLYVGKKHKIETTEAMREGEPKKLLRKEERRKSKVETKPPISPPDELQERSHTIPVHVDGMQAFNNAMQGVASALMFMSTSQERILNKLGISEEVHDIGFARKSLSDGKFLARHMWNDEYYIFMIKPAEWTFTNGKNDNCLCAPFIAKKIGDVVSPWEPSQEDVLETDWYIVE